MRYDDGLTRETVYEKGRIYIEAVRSPKGNFMYYESWQDDNMIAIHYGTLEEAISYLKTTGLLGYK